MAKMTPESKINMKVGELRVLAQSGIMKASNPEAVRERTRAWKRVMCIGGEIQAALRALIVEYEQAISDLQLTLDNEMSNYDRVAAARD